MTQISTNSRIRELALNAPFIQQIGMEIIEIGSGWITCEIVIQPEKHHQQNGFIHAGVQATLADHAAGCAAATVADSHITVLTVEFKINLLRPAIGERLTCRADVLKAGRSITVVESNVWAWQAEQSKLVSKATVTIANVTQ